MPIKWEEFDKDIDIIIKESADKTDDQLASRISSLTRMTDKEVKELFPEPADIKKLTKLMKIVKSAEDRNIKIAKIESNAKEFSGIVLSLLSKLA